MKPASAESAEHSKDAPLGFGWRLALKAAYAIEAADYRAETYGRKGWHALTRLVQTLLQLGRPVLFLGLLCLVVAGSLAPVDGHLAVVFLLAGSVAFIAFVVLARRG
jgi:hypothetical protein